MPGPARSRVRWGFAQRWEAALEPWVLGAQVGRLERFAQAFGDNVHLAVATGCGDAVRKTTGEVQQMSKRENAAETARLSTTGGPSGGSSLSDPNIPADLRERSRPAVEKPKAVRVSLDLVPALYEDLTVWNRNAALQLGRAGVTNADTLRHLVRVLLDENDRTVADEVIRRLDSDQ